MHPFVNSWITTPSHQSCEPATYFSGNIMKVYSRESERAIQKLSHCHSYNLWIMYVKTIYWMVVMVCLDELVYFLFSPTESLWESPLHEWWQSLARHREKTWESITERRSTFPWTWEPEKPEQCAMHSPSMKQLSLPRNSRRRSLTFLWESTL